MSTSITASQDTIHIEIDEGCVKCPFNREAGCGCDESVVPTHDYSYPSKCPLLDNFVTVSRRK